MSRTCRNVSGLVSEGLSFVTRREKMKTQRLTTRKKLLSDALYNMNTPPSPGLSGQSSHNDNSSKKTVLTLKKLDHEIIVNLWKTFFFNMYVSSLTSVWL